MCCDDQMYEKNEKSKEVFITSLGFKNDFPFNIADPIPNEGWSNCYIGQNKEK